jgi:hypothetical protein
MEFSDRSGGRGRCAHPTSKIRGRIESLHQDRKFTKIRENQLTSRKARRYLQKHLLQFSNWRRLRLSLLFAFILEVSSITRRLPAYGTMHQITRLIFARARQPSHSVTSMPAVHFVAS